MYGLVNAAVQQLVCDKFGEEKWREIRQLADVPDDTFSRMAQYPDKITYDLVGAASKVLGITPDDTLRAFGEYWVLYTGAQGYGHLFDLAGGSLRDFLLNLDNLHTRIGQNFTQLRPPSFQFDDADLATVRMHYYSERQGLCPMVEGLLAGLSQRFNTPLAVRHATCSREGADHCEFILTIGDRQ